MAKKALMSAAIALTVTVFSFVGELTRPGSRPDSDIKHKTGTLLKEAAGKQPASANVNWYDGPARDFFRDILEMNQKYSAEGAALDSSAIKDLYSSASYISVAHMQKVIAQLRAAQAVDEKYSSLDPIVKKMEDRVAATDVSESKKTQFLQGVKRGMEPIAERRRELRRVEEDWMGLTIGVYEFMIAHKSEYSVRDKKIYFTNHESRVAFVAQQEKAIAAHKEFLKTKSAMEELRKKRMDQIGVSPSDLTPSQLGKPQ